MAKKLKSEADDHVNPFAGWLLPPDAQLRPKLKNARSKPSISAKSRSLVKMEDNDGASTSVKLPKQEEQNEVPVKKSHKRKTESSVNPPKQEETAEPLAKKSHKRQESSKKVSVEVNPNEPLKKSHKKRKAEDNVEGLPTKKKTKTEVLTDTAPKKKSHHKRKDPEDGQRFRVFIEKFQETDYARFLTTSDSAEIARSVVKTSLSTPDYQSSKIFQEALVAWSNTQTDEPAEDTSFSGQYSIIAFPSVSHKKRLQVVFRELQKLNLVQKGTHPASLTTKLSAAETFECTCGAQAVPKIKALPIDPKKPTKSKPEDQIRWLLSQSSAYPKRTVSTSSCAGSVRITVREDDSHVLGIPGEQVKIEFLH